MQRKNPIDIAEEIIFEVRNEINIYLGRQRPIASEIDGVYVYPADISGRLTKLQSIVGQYPIEDNQPLSLLDLLQDTDRINRTNLISLLQRLHDILQPVDGLPRIRKPLKDTVKNAINNLLKAVSILEEKKLKSDIKLESNTKAPTIMCIPVTFILQNFFSNPFTLFTKQCSGYEPIKDEFNSENYKVPKTLEMKK